MSPSRYARKSKCRVPIKFYISPEGSKTEYNYFDSIKLKKELRLEQIEIIPIPRKKNDTKSSPEYVINRLDRYLEYNKIEPSEYNYCALVIDFDNWGEKKLKEINSLCKQKEYYFYVSNPCIEIWFILHKKKVKYIQQNIEKVDCCENCKQLCDEIFSGNYDKLYPLTYNAIENAEKLDNNPNEDWPNEIGTHLYKLFKIILDTRNC